MHTKQSVHKKIEPQPFWRGCFIRFAHIEMVRDSAAMVHWWTLEIKGYNVHMEMAFNSNPSYPASRDNVVPLEKHSQSPPQPVLHPPAVQCASPKLNLATWPLCWPLSACYLPKCKKAILWARHSVQSLSTFLLAGSEPIEGDHWPLNTRSWNSLSGISGMGRWIPNVNPQLYLVDLSLKLVVIPIPHPWPFACLIVHCLLPVV